MKEFFYYLLTAIIFISIGWFGNIAYHLPRGSNLISEIKPRPLDKYSIENLQEAYKNLSPSKIEIGKVIKDYPKFTAYEFTFKFSPDLSNNLKTVSGLMNIPKSSGPHPLVIMFRGYIDQKIYTTGMGTQHAGEFFANNGFITIAPDFLGYGDSDPESENIFESRFQTYTTAMSLLTTVHSVKGWDRKNIFIWAHSNGGQVALTTLEISGVNYPTVLWAPVSKPFPYSILYYTDESDDHGKLIRNELSKFEGDYDVEKYSLTNYLDQIKAPIEIHQGTADDAVPVAWSDLLVKTLKKDVVEVNYIKHPGASHDLVPSWNTAVTKSLQFYEKHM